MTGTVGCGARPWRGRVDLGAWPGRLHERESRLRRVADGTKCERESRLGHPGWGAQ